MRLSVEAMRDFVRHMSLSAMIRDNHDALDNIDARTQRQHAAIARMEREMAVWVRQVKR
jgi:hypothetical protein